MGYGININTIEVDVEDDCPIIQGKNGGSIAITPGELLVEDNTPLVQGDFPELIPALVDTKCGYIFAVESLYEGKSINDSYAAGEMVRARVCLPGSLVLAWVVSPTPPPWSLVRGDVLKSNGGGTLTLRAALEPPVAILYDFDDTELGAVMTRRAIVRTF